MGIDYGFTSSPVQKQKLGKTSSSTMNYSDFNDINTLEDPYPDLAEQIKYNNWKQEVLEELNHRGFSISEERQYYITTKKLKELSKKKEHKSTREEIEEKLKVIYNNKKQYPTIESVTLEIMK